MLDDMTAAFWAECLEYYALEPFGPAVDDLRHGMLCATVLAPHMRKGVVADPCDYMVRRPPPREMTPEETVAFFRAALRGPAGKPGEK
jgi:hypothetical protein